MLDLLAYMLLFGVIGLLIGRFRNRLAFGFVVGFLLGPLGWLIVGLMPTAGPRCPACKGVYIQGATKCVNCGTALEAALKPA